MRILLALLVLIGGCDATSVPEATEASGPPCDRRLYGRPLLSPEDSVPDAFNASDFFPEPLEEDSCGSADAEDNASMVRIDVLRLLRQEHGEMPRFRGPGATVSLHPSRGFGRIALSTSGPSSEGMLR